jgi:hypothetical protein
MIVAALYAIGEGEKKKGSAIAIAKYIASEYPDITETRMKTQLKISLKKLVENKKLIQSKASYKLPKKTLDKLEGKSSTRSRSRSPAARGRSKSKSPSRGSSRSRSASPAPKKKSSTKKPASSPKPRGRPRSKSPSTSRASSRSRSASPAPKKKTTAKPKKVVEPAPKKKVTRKATAYSTKSKPRTTKNSLTAGKDKPAAPASTKKAKTAKK